MQIGSFFRIASGYEGIIETATLDIRISIVPADPTDAEKAPDWRVHRGDSEGPEIGAGWNETGERAGEYVSLRIDDPGVLRHVRVRGGGAGGLDGLVGMGVRHRGSSLRSAADAGHPRSAPVTRGAR